MGTLGVPADRIAYITGQEPARRRVQAVRPANAAETATPPEPTAGSEDLPLTPEAVAAAAAVATVAAAAAAAAAAPKTTKPATVKAGRDGGASPQSRAAAGPKAAPPAASKKRRRQPGSLLATHSASSPESKEALVQPEVAEAWTPVQPLQEVVNADTEVYAEPPPLDVAALQAALAVAQGGLSDVQFKQE
ncbi:hypothetical protein N2152v2_009055 [Parachlorella kessleri]